MKARFLNRENVLMACRVAGRAAVLIGHVLEHENAADQIKALDDAKRKLDAVSDWIVDCDRELRTPPWQE